MLHRPDTVKWGQEGPSVKAEVEMPGCWKWQDPVTSYKHSNWCGVDPSWACQTKYVHHGWESWRHRDAWAILAQAIMSELQLLDSELQGLIYIARFGVLTFALVLPFGNEKNLNCSLLFKRQLRDVGFFKIRPWTFSVEKGKDCGTFKTLAFYIVILTCDLRN